MRINRSRRYHREAVGSHDNNDADVGGAEARHPDWQSGRTARPAPRVGELPNAGRSGQVDRDIDQSEEFQIIYRVHDLINCALSDVSGIPARHDDLPEAPAPDKKMQDRDTHAASIPGDLQLRVHYSDCKPSAKEFN